DDHNAAAPSDAPHPVAPSAKDTTRQPETKAHAADKRPMPVAPATPPPVVENPADVNLEERDFAERPLTPREMKALRRKARQGELREFILRREGLGGEERGRNGEGPRRRRGFSRP
ncbi:MAG: hypothetical protein WCD76_00695, partial [Pyrinomonadaceae bacterium]